MKLTFQIIFLMIATTCFGQSNPDSEPSAYVKINNWEKRGLAIDPKLFDRAETMILNQISAEEFEKVKANCNSQNWPAIMQPDIGKYLKDTVARAKFYEMLDKLKMKKIATFENVIDGKFFGKVAIIKVPYEENMNWDKAVKWDTIYFIIYEKYVVNSN